MIKVTHCTWRELETMKESDTLQADTPYAIKHEGGTMHYAWSPDGVGVYWYDTLNELLENH
jgi:hypothetical protein